MFAKNRGGPLHFVFDLVTSTVFPRTSASLDTRGTPLGNFPLSESPMELRSTSSENVRGGESRADPMTATESCSRGSFPNWTGVMSSSQKASSSTVSSAAQKTTQQRACWPLWPALEKILSSEPTDVALRPLRQNFGNKLCVRTSPPHFHLQHRSTSLSPIVASCQLCKYRLFTFESFQTPKRVPRVESRATRRSDVALALRYILVCGGWNVQRT